MRAKLRYPLLIILPLSLVIGILWGLKVQRNREAIAQGQLRAPSEIRILTLKGLFSPDFLREFEAAESIHAVVTEVATPEEIWERLQPAASDKQLPFDLVTVFSYQAPLALQMTRLQPIDEKLLPNIKNVAPDFRDLPNERSLQGVVPVLWGLTGIFYDTHQLSQPPSSWAELVQSPKWKGRVLWPASTTEIARIANVPSDGKDLKRFVQPWLAGVRLLPDFLTAAGGLIVPDPKVVAALVSHGETAFEPLISLKQWKFTVPQDRAALWMLALAVHHDATHVPEAHTFINYALERESALKLSQTYHQASTNRLLESTETDARLKPSYLREVPLTRVTLWKDFSRAREIRELVPLRSARDHEPNL